MRRGDMDGQLMRRAIQQIAVSIAQIEHGCDRCGPNAGCRGFRSDCQLLCSEADGDLHTCLKALGIDFAKVDPATGHVDGRSTIRIAYDRCLDQVGFAHELGDKPGPRVAIDLVGCPELLKLAPVEDCDPVGKGKCLVLVVGDEDGCGADQVVQAPLPECGGR